MNDEMMYRNMYGESLTKVKHQRDEIESLKAKIEVLQTEMKLFKSIMKDEIERLQKLLGERLSMSNSVREQHGRDESFHASAPPEAVAFAECNKEVADIVRICVQHQKPIIPFGTGTSLEGHSQCKT